MKIQEIILDAPVIKVTLLEDRARVQRQGKIRLESGLWRLRVENVAPVLSDKSLRGEWVGDSWAAIINDVRLLRKMLVKETDKPAEIQALLAEVRQLSDTFKQKSEARQHQETTFQEITAILIKSIQEIPVDAVWGQLDPKGWRTQLQTLFQRLRDLRAEVLNTYHHQQQLADKINDLIKHIRALARPDLVYQTHICADVMISQPAEYEISFEYVVPNALWRPWHQAQLLLNQEEKLLHFRCDGCVWQRTGEDWQDVELVFSTARASLGTQAPKLTDDPLNVQDTSETITIQTREQKVQTTGLGVGATPVTPSTVNLPGVDDGGEVRNLRSPNVATIPSDGRPYRLPLFTFETPAEVEYVLTAELTPQVILKSEQINSSCYPILAGPVDLIRSSEFVGKTSLLFIAPGEKFALGWGADAGMRVQRTTRQKKEQDRLTKWNKVTIKTELFLSNIGSESRIIKTTERVPVSEIEQVKIGVLTEKTTEGIDANENGFCTWYFHLEPYSQKQATLVYQIEAAPEVQGI